MPDPESPRMEANKDGSNQPIISVGIIGSSDSAYSKPLIPADIANNTNSTQQQQLHDPFEWIRRFRESSHETDECAEKSMLSIHDDIDTGTVYVYLPSHHDLDQLNQLLTILNHQSTQYDFHRKLQSHDYGYVKSLMFLFLCCHHVVLFQDAPRFNPQWLSIFHFLQEMKLKMLLPTIEVLAPVFEHIVAKHTRPAAASPAKDDDNSSRARALERSMHFLAHHNLAPFIVPALTLFYPAPNIAGYIALDEQCSRVLAHHDVHGQTVHTLQQAVLKRFRARMQHQIVVLLRRCHAVFPYWQTHSAQAQMHERKPKYWSSTQKELSACLEQLQQSGFDTSCCSDEEIYAQHSRFMDRTYDMWHLNPLSLFSLLPHRFMQTYERDLMQSTQFLMNNNHNHPANDGSVPEGVELQRQRDDAMQKLTHALQNMNKHISFLLRDEKPSNGDTNGGGGGGGRKMPPRIWYYVAAKTVYDVLFKNEAEIAQITPMSVQSSYVRIHRYWNGDSRSSKQSHASSASASSSSVSLSRLERQFNHTFHVNLDTDRLARYSSMLCRRAFKSARNAYLSDLPEMYPMRTHHEHVKTAMKVYRQQSVGPLQAHYCRALYVDLHRIWKNGRQACDAVSLTGRPCCRPVHSGKMMNLHAMRQNESAKFAEERHQKFGQDPDGHFSGFSSSHACNCGRALAKREDPFDLEHANAAYFEKSCCKRVQWHYQLYFRNMNANAADHPDAKESKDAGGGGGGDLEDAEEQQRTNETAEASGKPNHYKSGFHLCNHGGAELYHKQTGITQPGFDRKQCYLLRWDIPIPHNVYVFHQHFKQKNARFRDAYFHATQNIRNNSSSGGGGSGGVGAGGVYENDENLGLWMHKIRKTVQIATNRPNCNAYFPCFVGLEFECYRGHRMVLDYTEFMRNSHGGGGDSSGYQSRFDDDHRTDDKSGAQSAENARFIGTQFPTRNVPLRTPCKQCLNPQAFRGHHHNVKKHHPHIHSDGNIVNGQLQRVFIVTPPPPLAITLKPRIVSNLSDAMFEFDTAVVLPPSSFLVLRFPYIYYHDGRGLPPDKLSLCCGMLSVQGHSEVAPMHEHTHTVVASTQPVKVKSKILIKHKDDKR